MTTIIKGGGNYPPYSGIPPGRKPTTGGGGGSKGGGASPQLLTSTGGLTGATGALLVPTLNTSVNKGMIINFDPTNFNCEENAQYFFRQEANYGDIPGEGKEASVHLIILKYRELGTATFSVNVTVFKKKLDDFITIFIPVNIPVIPFSQMTNARKQRFPDGKIHTINLAPPNGAVTGERPQISITRNGNTGPLSITKIVMCGNADEVPQL